MYGGLIAWFWLETAWRPILADVARRAPQANRLHGRRIGLAVKVIVGLTNVTAFAATLSRAVDARPGSGAAGFARTFVIALGATATVMLVLIVLLAAVVLGPVRDLIRGTQAVAAGDLDVQATVTSTDELGVLAESFNGMVAGLRER